MTPERYAEAVQAARRLIDGYAETAKQHPADADHWRAMAAGGKAVLDLITRVMEV